MTIDLEKLMSDPRSDPRKTEYERGRASAKFDAEHAVDELVEMLKFPYLADVLGAEWARGYREFGNAWLIVNRG